MTNIQAIDLLKGLEQSLDDYCELNDEGKSAFHMAITALEVFGNSEQLPPAQPEQHEGTWVYGEDSTADCVDGYRCSQCGFFVPWDYTHKLIDYINDYAYCPNCGADMRGEKDG